MPPIHVKLLRCPDGTLDERRGPLNPASYLQVYIPIGDEVEALVETAGYTELTVEDWVLVPANEFHKE